MPKDDKLELLSSVSLWENVPKDRLASLASYLQAETHKSGEVIFEEGSKGDGLYFVSSGHVLIRKKMTTPDGRTAFKELALLGPGHCMGEMTLFDEVPRSAQAMASDDCVLLKLGRSTLSDWLKANPSLAADFLIGLVQVLSKRLRRSSNELTLLFEITQSLMEPIRTGKDLLQKSMRHLLPHLEGSWSGGAYLYNEFNDEMELVASEGGFDPASVPAVPAANTDKNHWIQPGTFYVALPGKKRLAGHLVFKSASELGSADHDEIGRLLTTSARLIASTLENINHRNEEDLRARLSTSRQQYGWGFRPVALLAARAADQKKGEEIRLLDSRRATGLSEFVLLVNVLSPSHLESIEDEIDKLMKSAGVRLLHRDGRESDLWRVLDFGGLMVHLMHEKARAFYQLDKLYHGAPELPWREQPPRPKTRKRLHSVQRRNS